MDGRERNLKHIVPEKGQWRFRLCFHQHHSGSSFFFFHTQIQDQTKSFTYEHMKQIKWEETVKHENGVNKLTDRND